MTNPNDSHNMKKFIIAQKSVQTELYIIEAENEADALKRYKECPGVLDSIGSTGGWAYGPNIDVVVETKDEQN